MYLLISSQVIAKNDDNINIVKMQNPINIKTTNMCMRLNTCISPGDACET